jgi:hypothetical protein
MENRKRGPSVAARCGDEVWTEATAREVLAEWAASGQSLSAFAKQAGLVPQRLSWWKKRIGRSASDAAAAAAPPVAPASFVPVTVRTKQREAVAAAVQLNGAVRVELYSLDGTSAVWVAALAKALGDAS